MLASKKFFITSYVNNKEKNSSLYNFPIILIDLIKYVSTNYFIKGDEHISSSKQSTNVISHLHFIHKKNSLVINNYVKKIPNKNYYYQYFYIPKNNNCFQKSDSNILKKISLNQLIQFWIHPIRYFCQKTLNLVYDTNNTCHQNTEPFSIDTLTNYKMCNDILNSIIYQTNTNAVYDIYNKSGQLPHGKIGNIIFSKNRKKMRDMANIILQFKHFSFNKSFRFQINNSDVYGHLSTICNVGLLQWNPIVLTIKDSISLWLKHLFYCLSGGQKHSLMIGLNNTMLQYDHMSIDFAYYYLTKYLKEYIKGIEEPLLLTQSGTKWLMSFLDKKNNKFIFTHSNNLKGINKFIQHWNGNNYYKGEKKDLYIQRIIPSLTNQDVTKLCNLSKYWISPILTNQKILKIK